MNRSPLFLALLATSLAGAAPAHAAKKPDPHPYPVLAPAAVTDEEVGDAGSFGKNVKWLGLLSGYVQLQESCAPAPGDPPLENCIEVNPAPAVTAFNLVDVDRVVLPPRSTETIICHWQTPIVSYSAANDTGGPAQFTLRVTPTYRIENEVLDDPALVDPNSGLPLAGTIVLPLTSINRSSQMAPGESEFESITGTRMCIGGLVTRHSLINTYGLSPAQATRFFRRTTTIRLDLAGRTSLIDGANINIGTRFVGD